MRQAADEADRVYEHDPSAVRQSQSAGGGVERCKELVLGEHARLSQRVHQRRFSGVGVTDYCNSLNLVLFSSLACKLSAAGERFKPVLKIFYSAADVAAVGLELCFTRSSRADSSAQARHTRALAAEPREQIFKLRQLDLQFALAASCACGEDIEYQLRAVNDAHIGYVLNISLLRRGQLAVENEQVNVVVGAEGLYLLEPARAYERRGIGSLAPLSHARFDLGSGSLCQLLELVERRLAVIFAHVHADKHGGFGLLYIFKKFRQTGSFPNSLFQAVGVLRLPAPGVGAHIVYVVLCLPAEHFLCLGRVRIAAGDVTRAAGSYSVVYL